MCDDKYLTSGKNQRHSIIIEPLDEARFDSVGIFDSGICENAPSLPIVNQEPKENHFTPNVELNFIDAKGAVLILIHQAIYVDR